MNKLHKDNQDTMNDFDDQVECFIDQLPHDREWTIESGKYSHYVYLMNSYHVMNDLGFFVGYSDFRIRLVKSDFISLMNLMAWGKIEEANEILWAMSMNFALQFTGDRYLSRYYDLREYLTDTFFYALDTMSVIYTV